MSVVAPEKPRPDAAPHPRHSRAGGNPAPFARYPKYKDSGVAWLGEVPTHWDVAPLSALAVSIQTGPFGSQLHSEDYVEGEIPVINPSNIQDGHLSADSACTVPTHLAERLTEYKLSEGDIVFGRRGEMGRCAIVARREDGWLCGTGSLIVRLSDKALPAFLCQFLGTTQVKALLKLESVGSTLDNLNTAILSRVRVPAPPPHEQIAIASFISRETSKIDALIAEQEKLIVLLKEKRQALISHAVTKGLDPSVPMKDSGIKWLGQVPAHWDVYQMRRALACKLTNGIFKRKEEFGDGTLLVNVFDAYRPDFKVDFAALDRVRCDANEQSAYAIEDGDVLFVRSSLKIEGVAVAVLVERPPENAVFECHLIRARLRFETALPRFASFLLSSSQYRDRLVSLAKITTMTTIEQESLASLPIVLPPLIEQVEIAAKLDQEIGTFDTLVESAQHTNDLLKERRSALISAAVTGKIDVRGLISRTNTRATRSIQWAEPRLPAPDWKVAPDVAVWVSVAKLDAAWREGDQDYVGLGGVGASTDDRYGRFGEWLLSNIGPVQPPSIGLDGEGILGFTDGRHRFAWLRDHGAASVMVQVPPEQAKEFRSRFGTTFQESIVSAVAYAD